MPEDGSLTYSSLFEKTLSYASRQRNVFSPDDFGFWLRTMINRSTCSPTSRAVGIVAYECRALCKHDAMLIL